MINYDNWSWYNQLKKYYKVLIIFFFHFNNKLKIFQLINEYKL